MEKDNSIKLLFAGDFCCSQPDKLNVGGKLRLLIDSSDICELNFEGPVPKGSQESPLIFFLEQNEDSPDWCVRNGFSIINFANNHSFDFGEEGIKYTISKFANKATVLGVGRWEDAYKVHYVDCRGKRLGYLALSSCDLSSLKSEYDNKENIGCAWMWHPSIWKIIADAKTKCDYLFILPHAGVEYMSVPTPELRDLYHSFIDFGCDGVIASHPHVPQGWEIYNQRPIIYSLGNFVFSKKTGMPPLWNNGLIVQLNCNDKEIGLEVFNTIYSKNIIDIDISDFAKKLNNELCSKLQVENYMHSVNDEIAKLYPKYEGWLLSGLSAAKIRPFTLKRFIKLLLTKHGNHRVALHQLREESTRFVLTRFLKNDSKTVL